MFQVRVPATIANIGPGFDSFGLAVSLYNTFTFSPANKHAIEGDLPQGISKDPGENLIFKAMDYFFSRTGHLPCGIKVTIDAQIPLARGLGSSSSAIVAGLMAANLISGDPLSKQDLLQLATQLEGHPDNVAPALMGGLQLCDESASPGAGIGKINAYTLPFPADWRIVVMIPDYTVLTEEARRVLPDKVSFNDAVFNMRKASLLTYALLNHDGKAFAASLEDKMHQPYRGKLLKEWQSIRDMAAECGAFGAVISGSGPTMAVFYSKECQSDIMAGLDDVAETVGTPEIRLTMKKLSLDLSGASPLV